MASGTDLTEDFARTAERYAKGEMVMLIDGSGSMPAAFGRDGGNPVSVAVGAGREAHAKRLTKVTMFFFGHDDSPGVPISNDPVYDPMRGFPGGPGYLLSSIALVSAKIDAGEVRAPLHLVIVSDGEISDGRDAARTAFAQFLEKHPDVMLDVLIPSALPSEFGRMISSLPAGQNPVRVVEVDSAENLRHAIADAINTRNGTVRALEHLQKEATSGVSQKVTLMQPFRLRRTENL